MSIAAVSCRTVKDPVTRPNGSCILFLIVTAPKKSGLLVLAHVIR